MGTRGKGLHARAPGGRGLAVAGGLAVSIALAVAVPSASAAAGCPNEAIRAQQPYAAGLPDCRAYEQVSPVAKNLADAIGTVSTVQSDSAGQSISYFSLAPFPGVPAASSFPTYISSYAGGEWLAPQSLLPASEPGEAAAIGALTANLAEAVVYVRNPPPVAGAPPDSFYLRDNLTGGYRLLAAGPLSAEAVVYAGASADGSRIIFESPDQLLPAASAGHVNLYEWDEGRLTVAGLLPGGTAPAGGSVAGPPGGASARSFTQGAISEDGTHIFFTDSGTGQLYLREPEAAVTVPISAGAAVWRAATPNGDWVYYTEGENLFRFDVVHRVREALTSGAAGLVGTLGTSDDGSHVYFVATAALGAGATPGADNLYLQSGATTTFVAALGSHIAEETDWRTFVSNETGGPDNNRKGARVSTDGQTVLFSSEAHLTGFENAGKNELYRFDAALPRSVTNPACLSCSPHASAASRPAYLATVSEYEATLADRDAFLTRNLSADGTRVFFQTAEPLLPQDTNATMDVYEWELVGAGTCEPASPGFDAASNGCLSLISSGRSPRESYFGDASADGSSVFFFTRGSLVRQDADENADLYDARVDGGIPSQNPPPPPVPCTGEECRGPAGASPPTGPPASSTFAGEGNVAQPPPQPPAKPSAAGTRARELARALKACRRGPRRGRHRCEARARARFAKRASHRSATRGRA